MKLHLIVVFEVLFASMENREYLWEVNINHSGQTLRMHTARQFPVKIFKEKGKRKKQPCYAKNAKKNPRRVRVRSPLSIYKRTFSACWSKKTQVNERSVVLKSCLERTELPHLVRPMGIFLYYITSYMMVIITTHWSEILGRALKISPAHKSEKLENDFSQRSRL